MGIFDVSPETISADVIYIGFIFSLWIAITAAYVPGTGIVEGIAFVGFVVTLGILSELPTNWISVITIVIGGAIFMVLPFVRLNFAYMAFGGLVLQGLGGLLLFTSGMHVSLIVLVVSLLLPAAYHHFLLVPSLRGMRDAPQDDRDSMIVGQVGRVTKSLDPIGTIHVNSEQWTATTETEEVIEEGRKVLVIARENLRLIVEPLKAKHKPEEEFISEGSN